MLRLAREALGEALQDWRQGRSSSHSGPAATRGPVPLSGSPTDGMAALRRDAPERRFRGTPPEAGPQSASRLATSTASPRTSGAVRQKASAWRVLSAMEAASSPHESGPMGRGQRPAARSAKRRRDRRVPAAALVSPRPEQGKAVERQPDLDRRRATEAEQTPGPAVERRDRTRPLGRRPAARPIAASGSARSRSCRAQQARCPPRGRRLQAR
jgi:hypothetical protein